MSDNTVNSDPSFYKITVVTEDTNVNVTQGITKVVEVVSQGPQGPAGASGGGSINTSALATTGSNVFIGNQIITGSSVFYSSSLLIINPDDRQWGIGLNNRSFTPTVSSNGPHFGIWVQNNGQAFLGTEYGQALNIYSNVTNEYSRPAIKVTGSNALITGSLFGTASWAYNVVNGSNINTSSLATTGSNTFVGNQIVSGNLIPAGPYTNNTSSYSLGSPTAAWQDLYVSNGSVIFINGASSASIKLSGSNVVFDGASVTLPTSSIVTTAATASYYQETDPIFVAKSASLATTGSNTFIGSQIITGSLIISSSGTFTNIGPAIFSGSVAIYNLNSNATTLNSNLYTLYSSDSSQSVDWQNRALYYPAGTTAVNWGASTLNDTSNNASVDWQNRTLTNNAFNATVDWNSGTLNDGANLSLNWDTRTLVDPSAITSVDWDTRNQYDTSGSSSIDWANRALIDNSNITTVDWQGRVLKQAGNRSTVDWGGARLNDYTSEALSVDWEGRILYDNSAKQSIDWQSRVFYANDGSTPHLDWSNPSYMQLTSINEGAITQVLGIDGSGRVYYTASSAIGGGGGSTNPGGTNTQIQYNNNGTFGGVPVLTYNGTTLRATGSFTGSFTGNLVGTAATASSVAALSQSLNLTGSLNIQAPTGQAPTISGTAGGFTSTLTFGKYPQLTAPENGGITLDGPIIALSASSDINLRSGRNEIELNATGQIGGSPLLLKAGVLWLSASSGISASGDIVPGITYSNGTQSLGQFNLGSAESPWTNLFISGGSVFGTASWATNAVTASHALNVYAPVFINYTGGNQSNGTTTLANVHTASATMSIASIGFYEFEIFATYNVPATTVGIKYSISGSSSFNYLAADIGYSVSASDRGAYMFNSWDGGGVASSSAATTGNFAIIQGHINATSTGSIFLRQATEVGGQTVTTTNVTGYLRRLY